MLLCCSFELDYITVTHLCVCVNVVLVKIVLCIYSKH